MSNDTNIGGKAGEACVRNWKWLLAASLAFALGACASASGPTASEDDIAKLGADNSGIVLLHLTIKDDSASSLQAAIARRQPSGSYMTFGAIITRFAIDSRNVSGQRKLDPGEYAIVEVSGIFSGTPSIYSAVERSMEQLNYVYTRPIATFTVGAGEVVDLGTLRITETGTNTFSAASGPMPAAALQELAKRNAALHKARVSRPLTIASSSGVIRRDYSSGVAVTVPSVRR